MLTLYQYEQTNKLMIAAHRGSSGRITENTLAAFDDAISTGVKIIELDIQLTYDNRLVVYHDFYMPGTNKKISELSYDEIKDIEIGTAISGKYDSSHIPLLQDVIDLVKNRCYLMIEIKVNSEVKFLQNMNLLIDTVIDNNYYMNTIIGSFNHGVLKKIKQVNPIIYTAAIKLPGDNRLPSEIKKDIACDAFICSIEEINDRIDNDTKDNHIFTGVYTINDEENFRKALNHNVRAIATNYPEKILELLKNYDIINPNSNE